MILQMFWNGICAGNHARPFFKAMVLNAVICLITSCFESSVLWAEMRVFDFLFSLFFPLLYDSIQKADHKTAAQQNSRFMIDFQFNEHSRQKKRPNLYKQYKYFGFSKNIIDNANMSAYDVVSKLSDR